MKLFEIQTILDATILTGEDQLDRTVVEAGGADVAWPGRFRLPAGVCVTENEFGGGSG